MKFAVVSKLVARASLALLTLAAALAVSGVALADVRLDGSWPQTDKNVSIDADGLPRAQALKRLADAAGWSIVVAAPPGDPLDIHVKDQPAARVLEIILSEGSYVAKREKNLVFVKRDERPSDAASATPAPSSSVERPVEPPPPSIEVREAGQAAAHPAPTAQAPAEKPKRGEDRTVTGGLLEIRKGETVHDVSVFGGRLEVDGVVTGDLSVMGGSVEVHKGAHVFGDATTLGGSLTIEDGARVDGDVSVIGGSLERGDQAEIGGSVVESSGDHEESGEGAKKKGPMHGLLHEIGNAVTHSALLFVFGAVVLALATRRVETLRVEVASRPMRSFALGIVGSIAAIGLVIALCVTVVGIPVAVVGILVFAVAAYAGVAAVLTTMGEALLRHRTENPYLHLALGCAILLVADAIPYAGTAVQIAVVFCGIGVVIATRAAGLVPRHGSAVAPA